MSNENNENSKAKATNKPSHIAYQVRDGKNESYWDRLGVAWQHEDGKGFNLQLHAVPLDGRIVLRLDKKQD
jgi:hypothetical protein